MIVDGLGERMDDTRRLLFEYMSATELEVRSSSCASPDQLLEPLRAEVADPGDVYPPPGKVFLALQDDEAIGCIALRALGRETAEIRRLWVRPTHRGTGVARRLMAAACEHAAMVGVDHLVLDVLPTRTRVIEWYRRLGFTDTEPYAAEPVPMVFLARDVRQ